MHEWWQKTRVFPLHRVLVRRVRGQTLPQHGERRMIFARRGLWLWGTWVRHKGLYLIDVTRARAPLDVLFTVGTGEDRNMALKKRARFEGEQTVAALNPATKALKAWPLLVEFVAATAYEDGSPRRPGYFTIRNRVIEWEITLYDPDSAQRMAVRARDLDALFSAAEIAIGAPEAPWEPDNYLQTKLPKSKKK